LTAWIRRWPCHLFSRLGAVPPMWMTS
jgi:hypothetical protein